MNASAQLLPSIDDLTTRAETFIDSARKSLMLVVQLIELFHPLATKRGEITRRRRSRSG